jgi:photoprotection regulator FRP-like protein
MVMRDLKWSASEKKIAHRVYEAACESMLATVVADFKAKAAAVATPSEMWAIEDHLHQQRRKIDEIFDYRYSQLPLVFARLIGEGHLDEAQLSGLSEEKLEIIRRFLSWMRREA